VHAERGAGECLAVSAIAEQGFVRLDLGFKGDVSAVTTPVDFQGAYPFVTSFIHRVKLSRSSE